MELVNIKYAVKNGLVKATEDDVDRHFATIKEKAANDEWELVQKRNDRAIEYSNDLQEKDNQSRQEQRSSTSKKWIMPSEYTAFVNGIVEAIDQADRLKDTDDPGPFYQLLKYKPTTHGAGLFATNKIWWRDMMRILLGLEGPIGDEMRNAELNVYNGAPFAPVTGRKKILKYNNLEHYEAVGKYWRDKLVEEAKQTKKKNIDQLQFLFTQPDVEYFNSKV